jgi:Protein of unknown function (DUF5131)
MGRRSGIGVYFNGLAGMGKQNRSALVHLAGERQLTRKRSHCFCNAHKEKLLTKSLDKISRQAYSAKQSRNPGFIGSFPVSDKSKIEWTDATWNPVRGCSKVSPGCLHCYAETFAQRFRGVPGHPFEFGFDLRLVPEKLGDPLRWQGSRKIFVNSMSDLFHEKVPDEYIVKVARVTAA